MACPKTSTKLHKTTLAIALMSALAAGYVQAQDGINDGTFNFSTDTTISPNALVSEGQYAGIAALSGETTVNIADGSTLTIAGKQEDISQASGIYGISAQADKELTVNGDLKMDISTSSDSSIWGIRGNGSATNITLNGNVDAVISATPGLAHGIYTEDGSHITLGGKTTKIHVSTTTGDGIHGVYNYAHQSGSVVFDNETTTITVDNATGGYANAVSGYHSTTDFNGTTIIQAHSGAGAAQAVSVGCDIDNPHDTAVNFNGSSTSITADAKSSAYALSSLGDHGSINISGDYVTIEAHSQTEAAVGARAQYGGLISISNESADVKINVSGKNAYGLVTLADGSPKSTYGLATSSNENQNTAHAGTIKITGSTNIVATGVESATGIANLVTTDAAVNPNDGIYLTGKTTVKVSATGDEAIVVGVSSTNEIGSSNASNAKICINDLTVIASGNESAEVNGIQASENSHITLTGKNSLRATGGKAYGVWMDTSDINIDGTLEAVGDTFGLLLNNDSANLNVAEQGSVTTNTMSSAGITNLSEASLLSITGGSDTASALGTVNSTNASINLGTGTYTAQALKSTGTTTVKLNDLTATTVDIATKSGALKLAASGRANDQHSSAQETAQALVNVVTVQSDDDADSNSVLIEQGIVNDGLSATLSEDRQLANVSLTKNSNVDGLGSINALGLMQWRHEMNDLTKRLGELRDSPHGVGAWARLYGSEQQYGAQSITAKSTSIQVGADADVGAGWKVGAAFVYTDGDAKYSAGDADYDSYGLALYGTWLSENGLFVDLIGKYSRLDSDFNAGALTGGYDNNAYSLSAEVGWHFKINEVLFVEPQAEFTWGHVTGDKFSAGSGVTVDQDDYDSLIGRIGLRTGFYFPDNKGTIYARVSGLYDFDGETNASVVRGEATNSIDDDLGGAWVEFGVGANFNWTENTYTYVDLEKNAGGEVKENWRFNVGVRHVF